MIRKRKPRLLFVWILALFLCILPVCTAAIDTGGTCGTNIAWSLHENGTLSITGTGAMEDFQYSTPERATMPWKDSLQNIKKVIVGSGVTSIGTYACTGATNLTDIVLPDSLTTIGDGAFGQCSALTSVTIPASVRSIGEIAFAGCSSMQKLIF